MIRLNFHCSLVPNARQARPDSSYGSMMIQNLRASKFSQRVSIKVKAIKGEMNGETSGSSGSTWDPGLEIEVPFGQRPVNEYSSLKDGFLYSWGELGPGSFFLRLGGLWLAVFTVLGAPIAAASFNPSREPQRFILAAGTGTLFIVSLIVLRIYLILARDRLLGSYKVKPVVKLLKQTLVATGALLVTGVMLFIFATTVENFLHSTFATEENKSTAQVPKDNRFNLRKEELLKLPVEVIADDDLAAAAAEAADGRPI